MDVDNAEEENNKAEEEEEEEEEDEGEEEQEEENGQEQEQEEEEDEGPPTCRLCGEQKDDCVSLFGDGEQSRGLADKCQLCLPVLVRERKE